MHAKLFCALLLALFVSCHADGFDADEIDEGEFDIKTRGTGEGVSCPDNIEFKGEDTTIKAENILVNGEKCSGGSLVLSKNGGSSTNRAVNFFKDDRDTDEFLAGSPNAVIRCSTFTFAPTEVWILLLPDDDLEFTWSDVFGSTPQSPLARADSAQQELDDGDRFLIIGNRCFYDEDEICFPADGQVKLDDGSFKRMDQLVIGDNVQVAPNTYSKIFSFTHQDARSFQSFVSLKTASGHELVVTPSHYVYADDVSMPAKDVRKGMTLRVETGLPSVVVDVGRVKKAGLYNPQTVQGDIMVNGVLATTYTSAVEPVTAHAMLAPFRAAFKATVGMMPLSSEL